MERLIKEAKELAEQGVKELILVAQETTLYGKDLYGEKCLHRLVEELCKIAESAGSEFCIAIRRKLQMN